MAHTLTTSPHDQLDHLLATAVGRFGRPARTIGWADPELDQARMRTVARMRDRLERDYRIDSSLVATAIIERICDVGLVSRLH